MHHKPRKRFGQNFLKDYEVISDIIAAVALSKADNVVEIGPGLGALTIPMMKILDKLKVIEIDRDLCAKLSELPHQENLQCINADALEFDYGVFKNNLRLVGNLPYNIASALLIYLLNFTDNIKDMHFMLQKEVASRICARPNTKDYGRLSIIMQYCCDAEVLFDVNKEAFYPAPKVTSSIIRITPLRNKRLVRLDDLSNITRTAFAMRRKTIANNLKPLVNAEFLEDLSIDPKMRPEQISVADYVRLTASIYGDNICSTIAKPS
jgi:16S rRNA (adenine1518-N6/adenine1519-N6)-dimethyltransferase